MFDSTRLPDRTPDFESPQVGFLTGLTDIDTHEMIPSHFWEETFGPPGAMLKELSDRRESLNTTARPDVQADDMEITLDTVWAVKGPGAPAALDLSRRLAVMDAMGIDRSLVFPTFGLF